jgi:hypothetical protein
VPALAPPPESSTIDATFTVCCAKIAVAGVIIAKAAINLIVNLLFTGISPNNIKTVKPKLKV